MGTVAAITVVGLGAVVWFLLGAIYGLEKAMDIFEEEFTNEQIRSD